MKPPDALKDRVREFFQSHDSGVVCAYLFGSEARGDSGPHSDADIAVLLEEEPPRTLAGLQLEMAGQLEDHLGREVDLVVLNNAPVDLAIRVLRDGQLLFDRNPSLRIRHEVRVRNEFFDLEPYLREYRRARGPSR